MSITVNFYSFSKRDNSTAVPTVALNSYSCTLKEGTSLLDPVLLLEYAGIPNWSHFSMEGRYYKVTDIRSIRTNLIEVSGTVDVLASWKAEIQATTAFVAYDTSSNTEVTDRRLSKKTTCVLQENAGNAWDYLGKGFCVMINVVGETACATYATTLSNAASLLDRMGQWSDNLIPDFDDTGTTVDFIKQFANAIVYGFKQLISSGSAADCIKSAFIVPLDYSDLSGTVENIKLGAFNTGVHGKRRTSRGIQDASYVAIPWQASDWRRNAPFHSLYLYIPFIGVLSLSPSDLVDTSGIYIDAAIDETAGDAVFTVAAGAISGGSATKVIGQYCTNIAANFAIGASNITPSQLMTSIGSAAVAIGATVATGGAAGMAIGTAAIAGEYNAAQPIPSSVGGAGGGAVLALFGYVPRCMTAFHDTNVSPSSVSSIIGTPTNAVKSLSGLSGYVETRNASVSGAMTDRERIAINRYLDGGIYIE